MEFFLSPDPVDPVEGAEVIPPTEPEIPEPEPESVKLDEQELERIEARIRDEEIAQDRAETRRMVAEAVRAEKKQAYRDRLRQREDHPVKQPEPEMYENPFVKGEKGETEQTPAPRRSGPTVLGLGRR